MSATHTVPDGLENKSAKDGRGFELRYFSRQLNFSRPVGT